MANSSPCLKIAFAGSPEFAAVILRALQASNYPCGLALTQPDRPRGRGRQLAQSPVKVLAGEVGLPVAQPASLKTQSEAAQLVEFAPDLLVVAAYGLLLPQHVLDIPTLGCVNVHASLLPRWRGAAPIERAVMAGDKETGVAIMQMERGLDTGPIFAVRNTQINAHDSVLELENKLASDGAQLLLKVLDQLSLNPSLVPTPQATEGITYAHKLTAADRHIDWQKSASDIARKVWALSHRMPATTSLNGVQIQILKADAVASKINQQTTDTPGRQLDTGKKSLLIECGQGVLDVKKLKISRGKGLPMNVAAAKNGYPDLFDGKSTFLSSATGKP